MTSPTDKIPEDVMVKAEALYDALGRGSTADAEKIARAIMAERERCAKVAADLPHCELQQVSPSGGVSLKMAFEVGAGAQAGAIVVAIRGGR